MIIQQQIENLVFSRRRKTASLSSILSRLTETGVRFLRELIKPQITSSASDLQVEQSMTHGRVMKVNKTHHRALRRHGALIYHQHMHHGE